jgi:hypothetical protein
MNSNGPLITNPGNSGSIVVGVVLVELAGLFRIVELVFEIIGVNFISGVDIPAADFGLERESPRMLRARSENLPRLAKVLASVTQSELYWSLPIRVRALLISLDLLIQSGIWPPQSRQIWPIPFLGAHSSRIWAGLAFENGKASKTRATSRQARLLVAARVPGRERSRTHNGGFHPRDR